MDKLNNHSKNPQDTHHDKSDGYNKKNNPQQNPSKSNEKLENSHEERKGQGIPNKHTKSQ